LFGYYYHITRAKLRYSVYGQPRIASRTSDPKLIIPTIKDHFWQWLERGSRTEPLLFAATWEESGDCFDFGNNERQKILDSAEHHH